MTADFLKVISRKLFLSFITSKVFELESCATAHIVDHFKSLKKSIYLFKFLMTQMEDLTLKRKVLPYL